MLFPPMEGGLKPKISFGHLGGQKVDRKPKQSKRGFIQPSLLSQANVLLHSKHRTGLSWSSEHTLIRRRFTEDGETQATFTV